MRKARLATAPVCILLHNSLYKPVCSRVMSLSWDSLHAFGPGVFNTEQGELPMTILQKLQLKQSEIRQKLNALLASIRSTRAK